MEKNNKVKITGKNKIIIKKSAALINENVTMLKWTDFKDLTTTVK